MKEIEKKWFKDGRLSNLPKKKKARNECFYYIIKTYFYKKHLY